MYIYQTLLQSWKTDFCERYFTILIINYRLDFPKHVHLNDFFIFNYFLHLRSFWGNLTLLYYYNIGGSPTPRLLSLTHSIRSTGAQRAVQKWKGGRGYCRYGYPGSLCQVSTPGTNNVAASAQKCGRKCVSRKLGSRKTCKNNWKHITLAIWTKHITQKYIHVP